MNRVSRSNRHKAYKYHPKTKYELNAIIKAEIKLQGMNADLNCIDTSTIIDMSRLFAGSKFNGDISSWDVSNVTDMSWMFADSDFNGDISSWDTSKVTYMHRMFKRTKIESCLPAWYPLHDAI